jgi:hypothetical protein
MIRRFNCWPSFSGKNNTNFFEGDERDEAKLRIAEVPGVS